MRVQMIISGVGGQGVLFATRIFSTMALREGLPLIGSETHGMSQRGGSVITHLKIGEFDSPLVRKGRADLLFALEKNEAYKALSFVKEATGQDPGGICFVNAQDPDSINHQVRQYLSERGIEVHVFAADETAREAGSPRSANIGLIGFACAHPGIPFDYKKIRQAIKSVTPATFRAISLRIFDRGLAEGRIVLGR